MRNKFDDKKYHTYWDNQMENAIKEGWEALRWLRRLDYPSPPEEAAINALYHLLTNSQAMFAEAKELRK